MRALCLTLFAISLAAFLLVPLRAQDSVDSAIQAAQTAKNPESLEQQAASLESHYQYDSTLKVLEAALALRGQVNGDHSADYGLCLLKIGALERKAGRPRQAAAHYATAVRMLPGRPETAPVFLYLGIIAIGRKDFARAAENLNRAGSLDVAFAGPVKMWTGLMYERQDQADAAEAAYKSAMEMANADSIEAFEAALLYKRFLEEHGRASEADLIKPHPPAPLQVSPGPPLAPKAAPVPKMEPTIASGGKTYRVGGPVTPPSVQFKVDPSYSEEARVAKYSATVLLQIVVDIDGAAKNIKVIKPAGFGLDDCAVATVSRWRFNPGQKDGNPVPVYASIEVNFRLL